MFKFLNTKNGNFYKESVNLSKRFLKYYHDDLLNRNNILIAISIL